MRPRLRHLHLSSIIPYQEAQSIQQSLVTKLLAHKAAASSATSTNHSHVTPAPLPTLLTFTSTPTYTTGRREHDALTQSQLDLLQKPLAAPTSDARHAPNLPARNLPYPQTAQALPTLRGGLTTFHGPGQLVIYPTLDLISPHVRSGTGSKFPRGISARCYISLLEGASIATLAKWGIKGVRTDNPGVWVIDEKQDFDVAAVSGGESKTESSRNGNDDINAERKLAAVGVHLRRNVTSFGVGLNVDTDLRWFDRIVACGLVGKGVSSMEREVRRLREEGLLKEDPRNGLELNLDNVAQVWAEAFAKGIWGDTDGLVERVDSVEELWAIANA